MPRRIRALCAVLACSVLPLQAGMAETPPPDYFTGVYERVGRSAGPSPRLLNDLWRLDPGPEGLRLSPCAAATGAPLDLRFDRFGDVQNLLSGSGQDGAALWCQYFNDAGNYPMLFCSGDPGATSGMALAFALQAVTDDRAEACSRR